MNHQRILFVLTAFLLSFTFSVRRNNSGEYFRKTDDGIQECIFGSGHPFYINTKKCNDKYKVDVDKEFALGYKDQTKEAKCLIWCLVKESGMFDVNGEVNMTVAETLFGLSQRETEKRQQIENCFNMGNEDKCQSALDRYNCVCNLL